MKRTVNSMYDTFWEVFMKKAAAKSNVLSGARKNNQQPRYLELLTGVGDVLFAACVLENESRVELCTQKKSKEENLAIYEGFYSKHSEIESTFSERLHWVPNHEGPKRCRIFTQTIPKGINDEDEWDTLQDELVDKTIRFVTILREYGILKGRRF